MQNKRVYFNLNEINLLLLFTSAFSCALVVARILISQSPVYIALIWNLFLAWIPYIISYKTRQKHTGIKKSIYMYFILICWILFYPNAPYIITDLFHLNERGGAPQWFDLVLIVSFAMNGAILGMLSLKDMQVVISSRASVQKGWWFAIISLVLSGFGVYLGRYLRWNSWDVVAQTQGLTYSLWEILTNPAQNARAYGFTSLFSLFQILLYLSFIKFIEIIKKSEVMLVKSR